MCHTWFQDEEEECRDTETRNKSSSREGRLAAGRSNVEHRLFYRLLHGIQSGVPRWPQSAYIAVNSYTKNKKKILKPETMNSHFVTN